MGKKNYSLLCKIQITDQWISHSNVVMLKIVMRPDLFNSPSSNRYITILIVAALQYVPHKWLFCRKWHVQSFEWAILMATFKFTLLFLPVHSGNWIPLINVTQKRPRWIVETIELKLCSISNSISSGNSNFRMETSHICCVAALIWSVFLLSYLTASSSSLSSSVNTAEGKYFKWFSYWIHIFR